MIFLRTAAQAAIMTGIAVMLAMSQSTDDRARISSDTGIVRRTLRSAGDDSVRSYRIPGLTVTRGGTLIATFDIRHQGSGDLPAPIDVGMMRSTDAGSTWSPMSTVIAFDHNEPGALGNGVGDATVIADRMTGDVLVIALWSHGDRGWSGSGPGIEPNQTGQVVMVRSTDDGVTWSRPQNITKRIGGRDTTWRLMFQGPGSGIQLADGALIVPAQYRGADGIPHSCIMFSVDHGNTWSLSRPAIPVSPPTSEAQIAQCEDGSLLMTMRNESRSGVRAWARYQWKDDLRQGTWSAPWFTVPDPTVMASLVQHSSGTLLFSNPNSPRERRRLTVRTSSDAGATWDDGRLIDERPSAYSCLAVLPDGTIGLLYECGDFSSTERLVFARFSLPWLLRR